MSIKETKCVFFVQELVGGPGLGGTRPQRRKKERKDERKIKEGKMSTAMKEMLNGALKV